MVGKFAHERAEDYYGITVEGTLMADGGDSTGTIRLRPVQPSLFEVSYDTAYRDLHELLEKGLVKRQGQGRATYYVLTV